MSFDWKNYILLSQKMLKNRDEASFRTSVSRAYYGVFCIARNIKGFANEKYGVHTKVIDAYKNSNNQIDQKIGKNLDELKRGRIKSDYLENEEIKKNYAERMVILANKVFEKLNEQYIKMNDGY